MELGASIVTPVPWSRHGLSAEHPVERSPANHHTLAKADHRDWKVISLCESIRGASVNPELRCNFVYGQRVTANQERRWHVNAPYL